MSRRVNLRKIRTGKIQMSSKQNQSQNSSENMRMYRSNSSLISSIFSMTEIGRHSKMIWAKKQKRNWKKSAKNKNGRKITNMSTNHTIMDDHSSGWHIPRIFDTFSRVLGWHLVNSNILSSTEMNM